MLSALVGCLFPLFAYSAEPRLFIDDFDGGIQNRLGGYRNVFSAPPSTALSLRTGAVHRGLAGRGLRLEGDRRELGFCGYWIHFFDMRLQPHVFCDASSFSYLSFWVRGEQGGEQFDIKLADRAWIRKEDSLRVGSIDDFLPGGVTRQWQQVLVPLRDALQLDLHELGGVTFEFTTPGKWVVYIDDLSFANRGSPLEPLAAAAALATPEVMPADIAGESLPRALWVWSSDQILGSEQRTRELLSFCREHRIEQLWMQLTYRIERRAQPDRAGAPPAPRALIVRSGQWREFLRQANPCGVRVHALDGDPEFAVRRNHGIPLAVVEAVIDFNRRASREERFAGIHFDNEPYLLLGWEDLQVRERILQEFLELNLECQQRVSASCAQEPGAELEFGVDIPFWWQEPDETGRGPGDVTFRGKRQPASYHCLEWLDQVGVMNYRDLADGADGMIAHGRELLQFAERTGRAKLYMGVETFLPETAQVWFIAALSRERFRQALRGATDLATASRFREFRLHRYDDGADLHVGLESPSGALDGQFRQALLALAHRLGAGATSHELQAGALAKWRRNPEWTDFMLREVRDDPAGLAYPCLVVHYRMLPKLTFADNSWADFHLQTTEAETFFRGAGSFQGLAIHDYESFRRLVRGRDSDRP